MTKKSKFLLTWAGVFIGVIVVYSPALFTFFSQDDFTHLYISQASSVKEFVNFFVPVKTGIFYRPLSVQVYTWLSRLIFGLNPGGFHLLSLTVHLANTYLVWKILQRLQGSRNISVVGASFYGLHPSHFMSIFWAAEFSMVLAPFFAFLAIKSFLDKKRTLFWLWMFLGLLSNELTIALPLILAAYIALKRQWRKLLWLIPPFLGSLALMVLRFIIVPASLGTEYLLSFTPSTMGENIRWQFFRALGLPEGFLGHLELPEIRLSLMSIFLLIVGLAVVILVRRNQFRLTRAAKFQIIFGFFWFILSLLPTVFLLNHISPIYQLIGLPGFFLAISPLIRVAVDSKFIKVTVIGLFFVASFWAVRAQEKYHWVTKRARLAKYHLEKISAQIGDSTEMITFLNAYPESSTQVYLSMAGDRAVKVFYGNDIQVKFEDFSQSAIPENSIIIFSHKEI